MRPVSKCFHLCHDYLDHDELIAKVPNKYRDIWVPSCKATIAMENHYV